MILDGHKLIRETVSGGVQLYDLRRDPAEQDDIAKKCPDVSERLARYLDEWERQHRTRTEREEMEGRREHEHLGRLRTLGYL